LRAACKQALQVEDIRPRNMRDLIGCVAEIFGAKHPTSHFRDHPGDDCTPLDIALWAVSGLAWQAEKHHERIARKAPVKRRQIDRQQH